MNMRDSTFDPYQWFQHSLLYVDRFHLLDMLNTHYSSLSAESGILGNLSSSTKFKYIPYRLHTQLQRMTHVVKSEDVFDRDDHDFADHA